MSCGLLYNAVSSVVVRFRCLQFTEAPSLHAIDTSGQPLQAMAARPSIHASRLEPAMRALTAIRALTTKLFRRGRLTCAAERHLELQLDMHFEGLSLSYCDLVQLQFNH